MKQKTKSRFAIIIGISVMLVALVPYLINFSGGFSNYNIDWGSFGDYLVGISSLINVIVFIAISFIIHNLDKNNRENELRKIQEKELVIRFLNTYEELVKALYTLKINLSIINSCEQEGRGESIKNELIAQYLLLKKAVAYANVYILHNQTSVEKLSAMLNGFLSEELYPIIDLEFSANVDDYNILKNKIPQANKKINDLIEALGEYIKSFILGE